METARRRQWIGRSPVASPASPRFHTTPAAKAILVAAAALLLLIAPASSTAEARANAEAGHKTRPPSPFLRIAGPTNAPLGFTALCRRHPKLCEPSDTPPEHRRIALDSHRWIELQRINLVVNGTVRPMTDRERYGIEEHWTLPRWAGDCEDYVLLKRRMLIGNGWPESALLITVVRDETGEGHAVLTARTAAGDYVLDNRTDSILVWHETPYRYLKRQSYRNPNAWVALRPTFTPRNANGTGRAGTEAERSGNGAL